MSCVAGGNHPTDNDCGRKVKVGNSMGIIKLSAFTESYFRAMHTEDLQHCTNLHQCTAVYVYTTSTSCTL